MKELKRSGYKHMKSAVIASRTQLCINQKLDRKSNAEKVQMCRKLVKSNDCDYYQNLNGSVNEDDFKQPILDIEDLGQIGKKFKCCPFTRSENPKCQPNQFEKFYHRTRRST